MLTEDEKERCRYHLGYMGTTFGGSHGAAGIAFGVPRPAQTVFLLEQAISNLLTNTFAVDRVRRMLFTLDKIEEQLQNALCTLIADKLGDLQLHPLRSQGKLFPDSLEREYLRWAKRLADHLGVPLYPYSDRFRTSGPGRSAPVTS